MKWFPLGVVCIIFFISGSFEPVFATNPAGPIYAYVYLNDGGLLLIEQSKNATSLGDYESPATFCSDDSGYYCVHAAGLDFAVPRHLSTQTQWTESGRVFTVEHALSGAKLLGHVYQFVVIKEAASKHNVTTYFYYSPVHGLLGWTSHVDPSAEPEVIIARDAIGFGANPDQKQ